MVFNAYNNKIHIIIIYNKNSIFFLIYHSVNGNLFRFLLIYTFFNEKIITKNVQTNVKINVNDITLTK